jgi:CheY-like chemotaxis protein
MSDRAQTVLVVDDEPSVQLMLSELLTAHGYAVTAAGRVEAAIRLLQIRMFDAIVLDVRMPGMSGLALLEAVRNDRRMRDVPVFLLTGHHLTEQEEALVASARPYVFYKSERQDLLLAHLARVLADRRGHRES